MRISLYFDANTFIIITYSDIIDHHIDKTNKIK